MPTPRPDVRDQHAQVAQGLSSLPRHLVGQRLRARVEETCARALAADMTDVHRLARMLPLEAPPPPTSPEPPRVIPLCRCLRPSQHDALPFAKDEREPQEKGDPS